MGKSDRLVADAWLEVTLPEPEVQREPEPVEGMRIVFDDDDIVIVDGTTGEPACDHLRRFDEDLTLLADLGFDAYRFSVSWPRVQPTGRGEFRQEGLDVYDRMVDRLLDKGILRELRARLPTALRSMACAAAGPTSNAPPATAATARPACT